MLYGTAQVDGRGRPSEDRIAVRDLSGGARLFAVFDGHSGTGVVNELVNGFITKLQTAYSTLTSPAQIPDMFMSQFITEDKFLAQNVRKDSGSTATVAIVTDTHIYMAYAGDSPAILFDPTTGTMLKEMGKHEPTLEAENNRIVAAGGTVEIDEQGTPRVDGSLMVSRAFGDFSLKFTGAPPMDADWTKFKVTAAPDVEIWERPAQGVLALYSDGMVETRHGSLKANAQVAVELKDALTLKGFNLVGAAKASIEAHIAEDLSISANLVSTSIRRYTGDDLSVILVAVGTGTSTTPMTGGRPVPPIPPRRPKTKKQKGGRRAVSAKRSRLIRSFIVSV